MNIEFYVYINELNNKPQPETLKDLYGFLADGKAPITKSKERELTRKARATKYLPVTAYLRGSGG